MRSVRALLFAAAAYQFAAQLVAGELLRFNETTFPCHRLPVNVEPTRYELFLRFPSLDSDVYEGSVNISLKFPKDTTDKLAVWGLEHVPCAEQNDFNTIVLHADKSIAIQDISGIGESNSLWPSENKQKDREIVELVRDATKQMIAIRVRRGLHVTNLGTPGNLYIKFKGRMRQDKRGVYFSTYNDGERVYKHIVSQFQPTLARTVFPCFDEPRFKVPFSVRISHPRELTAYGNTQVEEVREEDGLATTRFATTPNMPVHMVAFAIGEFDEPLEVISTPDSNDGERKETRIRVITARGKRETARFALKVAQDSLEYFDKLILYDLPLGKLDIIAIADLDIGIIDSWGLAFVRDTFLWVDDETKEYTRLTTAMNIAEIVAHQWFGNLISASWWSDLWITQGLAAQLSFEFVQSYRPFNGSQYLLRWEILSRVLDEDQAGDQHPLSPSEENLQTSEQISALFDELQSMKSASMAQMVKNSVGNENYAKLRLKLIEEHANKTINFEDYKRTVLVFDKDPERTEILTGLLETFPKFNGVPLVDFWKESSRCRISVTSFNHNSRAEYETSSAKQDVAVQVKAGVFKPRIRFKIITNIIVETGRSERLSPGYCSTTSDYSKLDEWPSISTYYRTRYSDKLYNRLQKAIKDRSLGPLDRLQILDDASSLVEAGLIGSRRFKSLLDSYANEDHPAVLLAIQKATIIYKSLFPQIETSLESFKGIFDILRKYGFDGSGDESLPMQRARELVLTAMVEEDREGVRAAALDAFEKTNGTVALFLREPVYKAVVLSGSEQQVNKLLRYLRETKSYEEQIRLVSALALSNDTGVLREVKSWLESSGLKEETTGPFLESISAALSQ